MQLRDSCLPHQLRRRNRLTQVPLRMLGDVDEQPRPRGPTRPTHGGSHSPDHGGSHAPTTGAHTAPTTGAHTAPTTGAHTPRPRGLTQPRPRGLTAPFTGLFPTPVGFRPVVYGRYASSLLFFFQPASAGFQSRRWHCYRSPSTEKTVEAIAWRQHGPRPRDRDAPEAPCYHRS